MCVTNDEALAHDLRIKRVHGGEPKYYHSAIGGNFRLDALQAVILSEKLKHLDDWTAGRQSNAAHYDAMFEAAGPERGQAVAECISQRDGHPAMGCPGESGRAGRGGTHGAIRSTCRA
jgi:dTDP-4-amino-4,6-dideoxygalactose transaminase